MPFTEDLAALPQKNNTPEAKGFLPPIFRAAGHLLFVAASIYAAEKNNETLDETQTTELLDEIRHAKGHWDVITTNDALSTEATTRIAAFGTAFDSAITEFPGWEPKARLRNVRDLANRISSLAATLDDELVGLADSSAGNTL